MQTKLDFKDFEAELAMRTSETWRIGTVELMFVEGNIVGISCAEGTTLEHMRDIITQAIDCRNEGGPVFSMFKGKENGEGTV